MRTISFSEQRISLTFALFNFPITLFLFVNIRRYTVQMQNSTIGSAGTYLSLSQKKKQKNDNFTGHKQIFRHLNKHRMKNVWIECFHRVSEKAAGISLSKYSRINKFNLFSRRMFFFSCALFPSSTMISTRDRLHYLW